MDKLIEGYREFRADLWPKQKALFDYLAKLGQRPMAMVIACSDSRVEPAQIFNAGPGELFIVRNVANLVPPYEGSTGYHGVSAALEYAVNVLEVRQVVVLGHAMCGGIQALMSNSVQGEFIAPWVKIAQRARDHVLAAAPADPQAACETEAIKISLENLLTFPWVAEKVAASRLALDGAIFDIRNGKLRRLGADGLFADAA
jgi:carbonic anhydrase